MTGTVFELVEKGGVVANKRVTIDDLEWAATWLEQYEGDPEDDSANLVAAATVAAYLRREAGRREEARRR